MTVAASRAVLAPGRRLVDGWQLCSAPPGQWAHPREADATGDWLASPGGTVAAMLRDAGRWSLDGAARRFDAEDWWLRASFDAGAALPRILHLEGLAGLADLWVNGQHLLRSENMFVAHACALEPLLHEGPNTLHLRFASLDAALAQRRPRPRWRAPMIEHQQLRWWRQSPIGRMPGWTPPVAPLGIWRDVWLESGDGPVLRDLDIGVGIDADGVGVVRVSVTCTVASHVERIELELVRAGQVHGVVLQASGAAPSRWEGRLRIDAPARWWPHTHGEPALYRACLRIVQAGNAEPAVWPLRPIGFRSVGLRTRDGDFELSINGEPIFCRGACWMPLDVVSLRARADAYRLAVSQVREAGMNMLRVTGATVYEDEDFFQACDEQGVLVWQDFMFANMDYPADDPAFAESARIEAAQQLARWRGHACLAVVCGNSEVEQQAAMWGAPRELWSPPLFHDLLRRWTAEALPGVPYWPSSAHGGAFPHQSDAGTSSYYGVGAYLRAQDDARRAGVRFATECLAFANVPESATIARMPQGHALRVHHAAWKARTPRDLNAGWDFEDVRDHYLAALFGVDALRCRSTDHERYLALSRVVTGEVMADAFAEWRRPGSSCRGALVWFLRDLWAGAGWGLLDDAGSPKACWWLLRRALQPRLLAVSDEGGNGLVAHLANEPVDEVQGELCVTLFGAGDVRVAQAARPLTVAGRGTCSVPLAGLFDNFFDLSYSYRFGPPPVTLVQLQWLGGDGGCIAETFHFPAGRPATVAQEPPLSARLEQRCAGEVVVRLDAQRFAQSVLIDLDGYTLSDNCFHMAPGSTREIVARPLGASRDAPPRGAVQPLNAARGVPLRLQP